MRESWLNENQRLVSQVLRAGLGSGGDGGRAGLLALGPERETRSPKRQRSVGLVSQVANDGGKGELVS